LDESDNKDTSKVVSKKENKNNIINNNLVPFVILGIGVVTLIIAIVIKNSKNKKL